MPPRRQGESGSSGGSVRISPTDVDPLASLRISKVAVDLAGRRFLIPALDAAAWLEVLLDEELDPEALFPGLCAPETIIEVNDLIILGEITMGQMQEAIFDVIEAASGRRWWITLRLCKAIRGSWDVVGGELASRGVTPFGISLSYWLDGAYARIIRLLAENDPRSAADFARQLVSPPPGMAMENFDRDRAAEAFKANMNRARQTR